LLARIVESDVQFRFPNNHIHGGITMTLKAIWLLPFAALGLLVSSAQADDATRARLTLPSAKIGAESIEAGQYKVLIEGQSVKLTEESTGKTVALQVKVENGDKKYNATEVHSENVGGVTRILEIRIGGSKVRLDFRQPGA
jgi:hypothetical protein